MMGTCKGKETGDRGHQVCFLVRSNFLVSGTGRNTLFGASFDIFGGILGTV